MVSYYVCRTCMYTIYVTYTRVLCYNILGSYVDRIFITKASAGWLLSEHVTLDKKFHQQEAVAAPVTGTFPSL